MTPLAEFTTTILIVGLSLLVVVLFLLWLRQAGEEASRAGRNDTWWSDSVRLLKRADTATMGMASISHWGMFNIGQPVLHVPRLSPEQARDLKRRWESGSRGIFVPLADPFPPTSPPPRDRKSVV